MSDFRTLPQEPEAEEAVLGAVILSKEASDIVFSILEGKEFYKESHRKIYGALYSLREAGTEVDMITLSNELKEMKEFENVGGVSTLTALIHRTPTAANVENYCDIVKEKFYRRQIIRASETIGADAYAENMPALELMDKAVERIIDATRGNTKRISDSPQENLMILQNYLKSIKDGKSKDLLTTGFKELDKWFGGLDGEGVTSFVGPTKIGKSILLQNMAVKVAGNKKIPVGYATPDKPKKSVLVRFACIQGNVSKDQLKSQDKVIMPDEKKREIVKKWEETPLYVVGQEDIERDIKKFGHWVMAAKRKYGLEMVILDSASNLTVPKSWGDTDERRESEKVYYLMELCQKAKVCMPCVVEMANQKIGEDDKSHFERSKGTATWKYQVLAAWGVYKSKINENGLRVKLEAANERRAGDEVELEVEAKNYTVRTV